MTRICLVLAAVTVIGCGESASGELDASTDAELNDVRSEDADDRPIDTGGPDVGPADAGASPSDAGDIPDDTGVDALVPGDAGIDAFMECEPGSMRTAACGNCGITQELCSAAGVWEAGTCLGERECAAGSLESQALPLCGEEQRLCLDSCEWSDWFLVTEGEGECEPGETQFLGGSGCSETEGREHVCSGSCSFEPVGECRDVCGPTTTSPYDEQEVCVPYGEFTRGDDEHATTPRQTVYVSTFVIDVFPVTNARYRACRAEGRCAERMPGPYEDHLRLRPADHPVLGVDTSRAAEFCDWDGGGRLPTEAEWEKAVRGTDGANIYAWGNAASCAEWRHVLECPGYDDSFLERAIDTLPESNGAFIRDSVGMTGYEIVSDYYASSGYEPDVLRDPTGPEDPSRGNVIKGSPSQFYANIRISYRNAGNQGRFRCVRDGRD